MCCTLEQKLFLEPEEAHLVTTTCCSTQTQRRPYGELLAVEHLKCLGCCHCFQFAETKVSPQCFCAGDLVAEIVKELKTRMKARGDTGQIKRAEQLLGEIQILKARGAEHGRQARRDPQAPQHRGAAADGRGHRHVSRRSVSDSGETLSNETCTCMGESRGKWDKKYVYTPRSTSD